MECCEAGGWGGVVVAGVVGAIGEREDARFGDGEEGGSRRDSVR